LRTYQASGWRLPNDLEVIVKTKLLVACDDGNLLGQCMGDNLSIERLTVMHGQIEKTKRLDGDIPKQLNAKILESSLHLVRTKIDFVDRVFDRGLGERNRT